MKDDLDEFEDRTNTSLRRSNARKQVQINKLQEKVDVLEGKLMIATAKAANTIPSKYIAAFLLRSNGHTLESIADSLEVSRERVRQILAQTEQKIRERFNKDGLDVWLDTQPDTRPHPYSPKTRSKTAILVRASRTLLRHIEAARRGDETASDLGSAIYEFGQVVNRFPILPKAESSHEEPSPPPISDAPEPPCSNTEPTAQSTETRIDES